MSINQAVWKINGAKPEPVAAVNLDKEKELEDLLFADIGILNSDWLLIGRQVLTDYNKYIDLLAIDRNGSLVIIELKRDKTPRDVVAQAIDYASWVKTLEQDKIAEIYKTFSGKYLKDERGFEKAFSDKFNDDITEDTLNQGHQMVIVASELDSSTERIVKYLSDSDIPLNVVFFKVFSDNGTRYLSRAWLIEPIETEENAIHKEQKGTWNGEYYVSYGENDSRNWEDARKYGFISAGGGTWYSQTLNYLNPGDRIWVNIPKTGYVGVGRVIETVKRADQCLFAVDGKEKTIYELDTRTDYRKAFANDDDKAEYVVKVEWIKSVDRKDAVKEIGLFGNQNSVCKPKTLRWEHTVNRLKEIWNVE